MNLSWIDWTIVVIAIIGIRMVSWTTRSAMQSVADFLSANRSAGRYLLTVAGEMGNMGAISLVAIWQAFTSAGFPTVWWGFMRMPLGMILIMTGWVYIRLRETRALTVAQFLEIRYSRNFRIFAGFLCFVSGVLNFGIFPAVAARFLIYFCGFPDTFFVPFTTISLHTFPVIMALDLGLALLFVTGGGQISLMVTECAQGMVAGVAFVLITIATLMTVSWNQMMMALHTAPPDASMIHPYHTSQVKDFNFAFYLIGIIGSIYGANTWLGAQGFMTSARNPHEQRMGQIIGIWRGVPLALMSIVLPLGAFALLKVPDFAPQLALVKQTLATIPNESIRSEMQVPVALAHLLPVGAKGLLAMVVLFFSFTCHDTYMHSWGSIFVQDVVMPLRKKPFTPEQHIKWLRGSIVGVAVFAFFFSLFYTQPDKILFFFAITGAIWLGGAGAVMIGGLYWPRGTTAGAYAALIVGAVIGIAGVVVPAQWKNAYGKPFPIDGQWLYLISMVTAFLSYVIVSLLTSKKPFDLNKMLHRDEQTPQQKEKAGFNLSTIQDRFRSVLGFTGEFTMSDRILSIALVVWNLGWFAVFIVMTLVNMMFGTSQLWWEKFWHVYIWMMLAISIPSVIWFTIGGSLDIRALFHLLQNIERDHSDDGRVHHEPEHVLEPVPDLIAELPVELNGMTPTPVDNEGDVPAIRKL